MSDENVIIYDHSKGLYWGKDRGGYTWGHSAGVYTRAEAESIALGCKGDRRLEFHPVPTDHIPTLKARIAELEAALKDVQGMACPLGTDSGNTEILRIAERALMGEPNQ